MALIHEGISDFIIVTDILLWIIVMSYIIVSILNSIGVAYHIGRDVAGLNYLPFDTNYPYSITFPIMVLFS